MPVEVKSLPSSAADMIMAREASVGVLPGSPQYFGIDVNSYSNDFGPTLGLLSRRVVNQRRRLRGDIVSEDVAAGFQIDFTPTVIDRLLPAMFIANTNAQPAKGTVFDTGISVVATGYDIGTDAATAGWQAGHLLYAENFATAANNGLQVVTGTTGDVVEVSGLTIEGSPPDTAVIRAVGMEFGSGELDVVKTGGEFPELVISSGILDFTDFNLVAGSRIYIDRANGAAGNRFVTAANNGEMRVLSVAAAALTIDRADGGADLTTEMSSETGTGLSIRIFFSDRIVDTAQESDAAFNKLSHFMERRLGVPNPVGSPGVIQTEDMFGTIFADWVVQVQARTKTVIEATLLGISSAEHTGEAGDLRTTDGATILSIAESGFFNNSSHVVRSLVSRYSETGGDAAPDPLINFVTKFELAFSNNAEVQEAVGRASGFDVNVNGLTADITIQNYFTEVAQRQSIRNNDRIQFELTWKRPFNGRDVAFTFDFPSCSLGDGKVEAAIDQSLRQPLTLEAAQSIEHDQTASGNMFWYIP